MKLRILAVALSIVSLAAAFIFYNEQPIYLVAFALLGIVIALYVLLMARVFSKRLSATTLLSIWLAVLALSICAELWIRSNGTDRTSKTIGAIPELLSLYKTWVNHSSTSEALDADQVAWRNLADVINSDRCSIDDHYVKAKATDWYKVLLDQNLSSKEALEHGRSAMINYREIKDDMITQLQNSKSKGQAIIRSMSPFAQQTGLSNYSKNQQVIINAEAAIRQAQAPELATIDQLLHVADERLSLSPTLSSDRQALAERNEEWKRLISSLMIQQSGYQDEAQLATYQRLGSYAEMNWIMQRAQLPETIRGYPCDRARLAQTTKP